MREASTISPRKTAALALAVTLAALALRLAVAVGLSTDAPGDSVLYRQLAINMLERRAYSIEEAPPYDPTYIRMPGYPLFLAGVYALAGHGNDRAVRIAQAVMDTATCWLAALLALVWCPRDWDAFRRRRLLLWALGLAAFTPFGLIFTATVLAETGTLFFGTAFALVASLALREGRPRIAALLWLAAGILGGAATHFRPDMGLWLGAAGLAMVAASLVEVWKARRTGGRELGSSQALVPLGRAVVMGAALSLGFLGALAPWMARNAATFGVLQPISPPAANMPGEFVPWGYGAWLRTWVTDFKYVDPYEWEVDTLPLDVAGLPSWAFDSPGERERVAALFDRYNHAPVHVPRWAHRLPAAPPPPVRPEYNVEMTPEVDAGFAELARERIARHPLRFYLVLPLVRAGSLWFDTHSHYFPFDGELFPLSDLDDGQGFWLPLFSLLLWALTAAALLGLCVVRRGQDGWVWVLFLALLVVPRLLFLGTIPNPEPRYTVEFFPLACAAAAVAAAAWPWRREKVPLPR